MLQGRPIAELDQGFGEGSDLSKDCLAEPAAKGLEESIDAKAMVVTGCLVD
jgi:hypothetical protein